MNRRTTGLFRVETGYDATEVDILRSLAEEVRYEPGRWICRQDELPGHCVLTLEGEVDVLLETDDQVFEIAHFQSGHVVGQFGFMHGGRRPVSVRALTEVRALLIGGAVFRRLMTSVSSMAIRFQQQVAIDCVRQVRGVTAQTATLARQLQTSRPRTDTVRPREEAPRPASPAPASRTPSALDLIDNIEIVVSDADKRRRFEPGR